MADGSYGTLTPNGTWNGMVGMVERNEVDVGVISIIQTKARLKSIDFTRPVTSIRMIRITSVSSTEGSSMWIHTEMFTIDDWVLILFGCLLISLMLSCFNDQEESKPPTCGRVFKMKDSLAMATQHMVGLGDLDLPIQSWLGSKITLLTSSISSPDPKPGSCLRA